MRTRVKQLRKEKNISQVTLSTRVGCSQNTISKIEKGECDPRGGLLIELAVYFGVSVDYILYLTDQRCYVETTNPHGKQNKYINQYVQKYTRLDFKNQEVVNHLIDHMAEMEE